MELGFPGDGGGNVRAIRGRCVHHGDGSDESVLAGLPALFPLGYIGEVLALCIVLSVLAVGLCARRSYKGRGHLGTIIAFRCTGSVECGVVCVMMRAVVIASVRRRVCSAKRDGLCVTARLSFVTQRLSYRAWAESRELGTGTGFLAFGFFWLFIFFFFVLFCCCCCLCSLPLYHLGFLTRCI